MPAQPCFQFETHTVQIFGFCTWLGSQKLDTYLIFFLVPLNSSQGISIIFIEENSNITKIQCTVIFCAFLTVLSITSINKSHGISPYVAK